MKRYSWMWDGADRFVVACNDNVEGYFDEDHPIIESMSFDNLDQAIGAARCMLFCLEDVRYAAVFRLSAEDFYAANEEGAELENDPEVVWDAAVEDDEDSEGLVKQNINTRMLS